MLQQLSLVFFITLWFSLELFCKALLTTSNIFFPLPTNLKIHIYPGIINVTWDCNLTKLMEEHTYQIDFPQKSEKINISKCFQEFFVTDDLLFEIHKKMKTKISSDSESKIVYSNPEGKNNTAAENLQCYVYHVSIINCSWTVGREAPNDTQYQLAFRQTQHPQGIQQRVYVACENYSKDSFGRQVGCILKSPKLRFDASVYVQLVGSSNETSIQFIDRVFKLDNFVILDPPRNISLIYHPNELKITWETPETYSKRGNHFFTYSVNINGEEHITGEQSFITQNLHLNKKVNVSVRAKWRYDNTSMWSRWSESHVEEDDSLRFTSFHLLLALGSISFVIIMLLIFLCQRFQIRKRLFPQIPKPSENIFETAEQNGLMFQEQNMIKKSLPEEDEECVFLQVTEIPHNEKPKNL
ncbi:granulocyte-macrophage colony-stimulating factor receptor subunit alpha-like isoform X2 [Pyxicephalus adspersus]|uniref:granulocyte-macrophage colony-stimulating factor receptor subunit alpha-like isoform X2 n=1 Tax=Pyxicephalus adspersus TaxID=30357 RepID=UPI003B5ACC22